MPSHCNGHGFGSTNIFSILSVPQCQGQLQGQCSHTPLTLVVWFMSTCCELWVQRWVGEGSGWSPCFFIHLEPNATAPCPPFLPPPYPAEFSGRGKERMVGVIPLGPECESRGWVLWPPLILSFSLRLNSVGGWGKKGGWITLALTSWAPNSCKKQAFWTESVPTKWWAQSLLHM